MLDATRSKLLKSIAVCAVEADAFPSLNCNRDSEGAIPKAEFTEATRRAYMALIAAEELGMSFIDALNRVTFTENGLDFREATNTTFENALRSGIGRSQQDAANAAARKSGAPANVSTTKLTKEEQVVVMPKGYQPDGKLMIDASLGELAYFYEDAKAKGGLEGLRALAWKIMGEKIPVANAFELGKVSRWIVLAGNKQPARREMFADVLTVIEGRLEALGEKK